MVRREAPVAEVVPGSTPVVAFGDPFVATVATLGINPSLREFLNGGQFLDGPSRRLATLRSLGAESLGSTDRRAGTGGRRGLCALLRRRQESLQPVVQPTRQGAPRQRRSKLLHGERVPPRSRPMGNGSNLGPAGGPDKGATPSRGNSRTSRALLTFGTTRLVLLNGRQVLRQVEAVELVEAE